MVDSEGISARQASLLSRLRRDGGDSPLAAWARKLRVAEDGVWLPREASAMALSYPDEGNDFCFAVEERSFWFRHRNACLVEILRRFPPGGPVFDVGGGNGCVAGALQGNGIDVVMVEPGPRGARNARRRGVENVVCTAFETAGFPAKSVPAIGLFDVVEHVRDDLAFLKGIHDVLEPKGRLYVTVPALPILWSADDEFAGHFRRYSIRRITTVLRDAGFEIERATYIFSFLFLPIFLFRTLPSRLRFRRATSADDTAALLRRTENEHEVRGGLRARVVNYLCDREIVRVTGGAGSRFGTSCIVVARAR